MEQSILEWALAVIGSGGIGAVVTYICTFKSKKKQVELREQMDKLMLEKSQAISAKCNEVASLKSKVTYLKGIRCYNFTCKNRIMVNPDKTEE